MWLITENCAKEPSPVFHNILVRSLENTAVLSISKDFVVVPVPKSNSPKTMNDFRPVALINLYCYEALWKTSMFGESEKQSVHKIDFSSLIGPKEEWMPHSFC